jgi:hypothetical protein
MANIIPDKYNPNPLGEKVDCIFDYPVVDTGWIIKKWFKIDLEKLRLWYSDLEKNYAEWKWKYGEHNYMWRYDANKETGGGIQSDTSWIMLTWGDNTKGPVPWMRYIAKPEYDARMPQNINKDGRQEDLGARECLYGYGLEILESMPIKPHDVQVAIHTPNTKLPPHQDGVDKFRFHIPIHTNEDARFIIDSKDLHLPADGWCYLVNTTYLHSTNNRGTTDRIHVYGNIWVDDVLSLDLSNTETVL